MSDARAGWEEIEVDLPLTPVESDELAADDEPEPVEITDEHGDVVGVAILAQVDGETRVRRLRWNPLKTNRKDALHFLDLAFDDRPRT